MGQSRKASFRFGKRVWEEQPPTLLVVEDQSLIAEYMADVAEKEGWQVEIAPSAKEFEREFGRGHPDVIALDLGLPDGDGVELLRHLWGENYKGSILIISSFDDDILETCERLAEHLGLRVTGRVRKPLTADMFSKLLGISSRKNPARTILPARRIPPVPLALNQTSTVINEGAASNQGLCKVDIQLSPFHP